MPSLPDQTDETARTGALGATGEVAPADVLERVKAEGLRRRRRRHRRNAVLGGVLAVAALAVPAAVVVAGDDGGDRVELEVAADPDGDADDASGPGRGRTGTTLGTDGSSSTTTAVAGVDPDTPVSSPAGPAAGGSTTTATAPVAVPGAGAQPSPATEPASTCRNSHDPACGRFHWDPAPAPNQPLTARFVQAPTSAVVGQPVTFTVAWSDPDSVLAHIELQAEGVGLGRACTVVQRYGPWTPPPPSPGSGQESLTYAFEAPGTYTVAVYLATGEDCASPYGDELTLEHTITVTPAP